MTSEVNDNKKKRPCPNDEEDEKDATPATEVVKSTNNNNNNTPTPITAEGEMPQKRFYRTRAHCNPLSHNDTFEYPTNGPNDMDWSVHFPSSSSKSNHHPTVLDIGCGFGGLTVKLSTLLPEERILGLEIRAKVTEYVRLRLVALRKENPSMYLNASVMRTNTMKYLIQYCSKASINKIFICFPDPHFKRKNYGRRIISSRLLDEYAYLLKETSGKLYCITDVKELHEWHIEKCDAHPLFRRLDDTTNNNKKEEDNDPCIDAMYTTTEESQKVERNKGDKYYAVYQRIANSEIEQIGTTAESFFTTTVPSTEETKSDDKKN